MRVSALLRIAGRNLSRNRRRSLLTLVALFVALTMMVTVRGALNAMNVASRNSLVNSQMGALQVHRAGFLRSIVAMPLDLDLPADPAFLGRIRALPHVRAVSARIPYGAQASAHDRSINTLLLALDPSEELKVCPQRYEDLSSGRPLQPSHPRDSVLTQPLLARLGSRQGETVALLATDRDGVMNAVEIEISGTLPDPGILSAEKKITLVSLAAAQELLRMPGRATELAISIDDLDYAESVAANLRQLLGPEFEVSTWHDLLAFIDETMEKQDKVMSFIASLFLFVALLGIANTMLMSVRERTREIGTMMAVGMRRCYILSLFVSEAAILGLFGSLLGILFGGLLVHHFGTVGVPLRATGGDTVIMLYPFITASWVLRLLLIAVSGAVLAALYPALRASRLRPIEALSQVAT